MSSLYSTLLSFSIGLENGQELEDIKIDYRLSVFKHLHGTWLISFYDYISSPEGKAVIASGWKISGIFDAVELGLSKLQCLTHSMIYAH